jgi:pyrimidine deaminase RibD-like protein
MELEMGGGPEKFVTLYGECFEAELRSVDEYQGRDGLLHKFYVKDMVSNRGQRLVSVFADWTLEATCANYKSRLGIVCLNGLRRAFDSGALSFDAPFDEHHYNELSLSPEDFQIRPARTDGEIRQYIIRKSYWLAYRFPMEPQQTGILYPIPFDEPADLDYMDATAPDIWRNIRRLANQDLLEKVLEGHARPTELLLSRYESGDHSGLGLTTRAATASVASRETADRKFARLAIEEARKSLPEDDRVHPRVGVVVVKDGRILALAHRGEIPQCHAEYIALEKKLTDVSLSGATVYTTLEPCTARKHPKVPCAIRLTERKVTRVVIGMLDPDKRIRGLGQMALRKARIATDFFQSDLMDEVEELNRDFMRDRESYESHLPDAFPSWKDLPSSPKAPPPPKLRVALVRGHVSNFLLKYANDEDEALLIREARLFSGKIELTEPLTPDDPNLWKVPAHTSMTFGKTIVHQKNPAASLVKMNSNAGIFFETEMDVVVSCEIRGQRSEIRQTLYVKVNGTNNEIVPLV